MEWIKISDKLPKEDQICWICTINIENNKPYQFHIELGTFKEECFFYNHKDGQGFGFYGDWEQVAENGDNCTPLEEVTHWMPLIEPELPDEVQKYNEDDLRILW